MDPSFFSIIIPTFNRAHTIHKPIDSILAQTFTDWELIIIDDGSTDETREVVDAYKDKRIKYFRQENLERSAARNLGILVAKGEWVCFQDSDDEYLNNHLQILNHAIHQNVEYKVFRTGLLIYENGAFQKKSAFGPISEYDQYPFECFTTFAFHSSILKSIKFDISININEDLQFLLEIGLVYKIYVIPEWTGIYHYNPNSSGGVGPKYEDNLINKRRSLISILDWNKKLIQPHLRRAKCFTEILMLLGHIKYRKSKILLALKDNLFCFFTYPKDYIILLFRILYVKTGEWSGLYHTEGRF